MMRLICLLKKKKKGKCMYSAPVLGLRDTTSLITRSSGEEKKTGELSDTLKAVTN
jgi:hypothetical protein